MRTDAVGLYVHIPFCLQKCSYCDFASECPTDAFKEEYIDALCREIFSYSKQRVSVDSVFFGGGTPSLLTPDEFGKIMDAVNESFDLKSGCEFTLEANPKTLNGEKLSAYLSRGVNRLSLGLQSIHENELKILGRIHSYDDFLSTYKLARDLGIRNINVDVMFGIPSQTKETFKSTVERIISLEPEHISVYGLILEEGTSFYKKRDTLSFPDEDTERDMYFLASDLLRKFGYLHYEISNFAKSGFESVHNLKYWACKEYIGVGLAAYSYLDGVRYGNPRDKTRYFLGERENEERSDKESLEFEYAMLALRTSYGISLSDYARKFGKSFRNGREKLISKYKNLGLLTETDGHIALTEKGFYVSNTILTDLL